MTDKERYSFGYVDPARIYTDTQYHKRAPQTPETFFEKNQHLIIGSGVVIGFFVGAIFLVNCFAPSDEELAEWRKPQIVQEFDGCKVYRFYDNNYHYITRCGSKITTQQNWDEYCGKACTHHRTEELTTEGNQ